MEKDLFGNKVDIFKSAKERYGIWPLTVWECSLSDPFTQKIKKEINDYGQARSGDGKIFFAGSWRNVNSTDFYTGKAFGAFNPAVAQWILNCYAKESGIVFDPFAGGGTRAIMSVKSGHRYIGIELRQDEVDSIRERLSRCGIEENCKIYCHDSQKSGDVVKDNSADFLVTCPPYWNMEQYQGGTDDLSMCESYAQYLKGIARVVRSAGKILKYKAISCWVVGLHRKINGELICLNHDIARIHQESGFVLKEEVILYQKNTGAISRIGNFEKGNKFLIRSHEYLLVFVNNNF